MTIEEMKAKGFKRFTARFQRTIYSKRIEIYAQNEADAKKIFQDVLDGASNIEFEEPTFSGTILDFTEKQEQEKDLEQLPIQQAANYENESFYSGMEEEI